MPVYADLYLDRIDLRRYLRGDSCDACRVSSWEELLERLRSGRFQAGRCVHWPRQRVEAFRTAIDAGQLLPRVPALTVPRPGATGLIEINRPTAAAPVLVTGNSQLTHDVLLAVLATATAPMWLLSVETGGHTVDMAMVYKTLTAEAIAEALGASPLGAKPGGRIILPGLAESLAPQLASLLGRSVEVGPICAAELPLYFGPAWSG